MRHMIIKSLNNSHMCIYVCTKKHAQIKNANEINGQLINKNPSTYLANLFMFTYFSVSISSMY